MARVAEVLVLHDAHNHPHHGMDHASVACLWVRCFFDSRTRVVLARNVDVLREEHSWLRNNLRNMDCRTYWVLYRIPHDVAGLEIYRAHPHVPRDVARRAGGQRHKLSPSAQRSIPKPWPTGAGFFSLGKTDIVPIR